MGSKQTQLAMQHLLCNRLYKNVARDTWPYNHRDANVWICGEFLGDLSMTLPRETY